MMESLTTIPDKPKNPNRDKTVNSIFMTQWPIMAPTNPKGITAMTINGLLYDANTHARTI